MTTLSSAPSTTTAPATRGSQARAMLPVIVAWLFVIFDGYDLIVYGTVQKALRAEWGLSPATAGTIGSLAFLGMMIGALVAGRLSDAIGRRNAIIGSAVVLSIFTALCAVAPNPWAFGALRLLAGLGLGGLVPTANALAADLIPRRWRAAVATLMMSGVPLGGSAAALLGMAVIPQWGWRPMFGLALVALVILVPVALWVFPHDAPAKKAPHEHTETASGFQALLRPPYLTISVLFAVATVVTLMAWYGLGTWLPNLLQDSGYNLGMALMLTLSLNLGAIAGSVLTAWAGDRFGTVPTGVAAAALAGVALLFLLTQPPVAGVYVILVLAGVGTHGTQCLIIAAIATYFPDHLRGTALGWGLGVGRIGAVLAPQVGGWLLAAGLGVGSNYLLFGGCAIISSLMLVAIWKFFGVTHDEDRSAREATLAAH
ncbi:MFS transporter, AAHS family, benzoate transport protein [Raineyella antarctica]|uniref:MFS transporter, AAHS family, benzoate transport protein n=1 Tax=Raineyella antarctica TaxID=1577474 RepID=A0A1G6I4N6_9ACTN|nr:aromatic acid/H+ symport family MFS transporter [Raineyella antarctica]SDC01390.1 MFS transporter, AAHS family, benzoate transport protein [Raineyella antarctica]